MSNLLDFVTITPPTAPSNEVTNDIKKMHDDFEAFRSSARSLLGADIAVKVLKNAAETVNKKQQVLRKNAFHQHFGLPKEVHEFSELRVNEYGGENYYDADGKYCRYPSVSKTKQFDKLTLLASTPSSTVSSMVKLADAFSMAIVPFSYLNKRAYSSESNQMQRMIRSFNEACAQNDLKTYVLCPIKYYSVEQHANSEDPNKPIYGGGDLSIVLASVSMNIPMFRALINQISDVKTDIAALKNQVSVQMQGMQRQVETLQTQVEMIQKRLVETEMRQKIQEAKIAEQKEKNEELQRRLSEMSFIVEDPIMFAVKDFNPMKDDPVLIGPCWGPDFDSMIAEAHKMKAVRGQKTKMEKLLQDNWL